MFFEEAVAVVDRDIKKEMSNPSRFGIFLRNYCVKDIGGGKGYGDRKRFQKQAELHFKSICGIATHDRDDGIHLTVMDNHFGVQLRWAKVVEKRRLENAKREQANAEDAEQSSKKVKKEKERERRIGTTGLVVGARIKARFLASTDGPNASNARWYTGCVQSVHADGTCDVKYDDDDEELGVLPGFVEVLDGVSNGRGRPVSPCVLSR